MQKSDILWKETPDNPKSVYYILEEQSKAKCVIWASRFSKPKLKFVKIHENAIGIYLLHLGEVLQSCE